MPLRGFFACLPLLVAASSAAGSPSLWPLPQQLLSGDSRVAVAPASDFKFSVSQPSDLLEQAFARYLPLIFQHEGVRGAPNALTSLHIDVEDLDEKHPQITTDESYTLSVPATGGAATATAKTVFGALHALETFSQLVEFSFDEGQYSISHAPLKITDSPRFPHRGLMIDTGRHFLSLAAIRGVIDTLPYAKLNVLHWHLVDWQSFAVESKSSPRLWEAAFSASERYTQNDIASIVEYARLRGVRVVPEFDMPGHANSFCVGYPEVCPASDCLAPLNVASNATWDLIEKLLLEFTSTGSSGLPLFPDGYFHLGGDEVDTSCWSKSPAIMAWLEERNMTVDQGYGYFVKRYAGIAMEQGRRPVQWSEVFDHFGSALPKEVVIHVWKGNTNVTEVLALGYDMIRNVGYFNNSWYLDNLDVTWEHVYANEPCEGVPTEELCSKILGGHGEMWGETVDGSDLEQTVWPRTASVAEKLWSSRAQTASPAAAAARIRRFRCLLLERGVAAAPVESPMARSAPKGPGSCLDDTPPAWPGQQEQQIII